MEHILIFEEKTGIMVPFNCCIHHLNGDKTDNRIENLCMMEFGAHTTFHNTGRKKSEATREVLSKWAKERFADKRNHPFYKDVNVEEMREKRKAGAKVKDLCREYGIDKTTYYRKMEEIDHVS